MNPKYFLELKTQLLERAEDVNNHFAGPGRRLPRTIPDVPARRPCPGWLRYQSQRLDPGRDGQLTFRVKSVQYSLSTGEINDLERRPVRAERS